jgi:hypothetical protein
MRNTKFRAWYDGGDAGEKFWLNNFMVSPDGFIILFRYPWSDSSQTTIPMHYITLIQSTGLKDKNSKEIYEGDIVAYHYWNGIKDVTRKPGIVFYSKSDASWKIKLLGKEMLFGLLSHGNLEIIGNLYENPELLNQQDENK